MHKIDLKQSLCGLNTICIRSGAQPNHWFLTRRITLSYERTASSIQHPCHVCRSCTYARNRVNVWLFGEFIEIKNQFICVITMRTSSIHYDYEARQNKKGEMGTAMPDDAMTWDENGLNDSNTKQRLGYNRLSRKTEYIKCISMRMHYAHNFFGIGYTHAQVCDAYLFSCKWYMRHQCARWPSLIIVATLLHIANHWEEKPATGGERKYAAYCSEKFVCVRVEPLSFVGD